MAAAQPVANVLEATSLIACDASGIMYGLACLAGTVAVYDIRNMLMEQQSNQLLPQQPQAPCTTLSELTPDILIHPQPALSFKPSSMAVSPSGRYLSVAGYDQEEEDQAVVVVIDLHGGEPDEATSATSSSPLRLTYPGSSKSRPSPSKAQPSTPASPGTRVLRHRRCASHVVDYQLYASRPGLKVRQMSWHPYSEGHLMVLTSDSRLRLYSMAGLLQAPQLTLHAKCSSGSSMATGTARYGLGAMSVAEEAVSFAWGSSTGWGPFTVYVASSVGGIYAVCPVTPPGMRCSTKLLQQLVPQEALQHSNEADGLFQLWLQAAFNITSTEDLQSNSSWTVVPHAFEDMSPQLQGPLNRGSESLAPSSSETTALAAVHHQHIPLFLGRELHASHMHRLSSTTALVSARKDGRLWAHVVIDPVNPAWETLSPRIEQTDAGEIQHVRYECVASPTIDTTAVLLDAVDMELVGNDDPDDYDSSENLGLSLHTLSAAGSHTIVASHWSGSWAIGLTWLPAAAQQLDMLSHTQPDSSRSSQFSAGLLPPPTIHELVSCMSDTESSDHHLPAQQLLSSAVVSDVLTGKVVLLLQEPGKLHFIRPTAMATATESATTEPGLQTPAGSSSNQQATRTASTPGSKYGDGVEDAARQKRIVEDAIQAVYGDLIYPPVAPSLPSAKGGTMSGTPEGAAYLTGSIKALRQGDIEAIHRTHAGLKQRAEQLDAEAQAQKASVAELQSFLQRLQEKQAELSQRASRAVALHANQAGRAALLSQLHWSLPRPLSEAEKQLSAELDVMASKQVALESSWPRTYKRAQALLQQHKEENQQQQPTKHTSLQTPASATRKGLTGPVLLSRVRHWDGKSQKMVDTTSKAKGTKISSTQMDSVRASIMEHTSAIAACSAELVAMQQQLKKWVEQQSSGAASQHLEEIKNTA